MAIQKKQKQKKFLPAYFSNELAGHFEEREARNLANWVLEDITGLEAMKVLTGEDEVWMDSEIEKIDHILQRLRAGEPIQYILKQADFYGLRLGIGPGVLIPRNETEELVEWIISDWKSVLCGFRILDVGCGSGAIAIALAKNLPMAEVFAVDISEKALKTCVKNAKKHSVKLSCGIMDILNPSGELASLEFDVIVSNPPYVLESQKPFLKKRVSAHEPSLALFVPDTDPLLYYRAVTDFGSKQLKHDGKIYVEINELLASETLGELRTQFSFTELRQDIHGRDRMIKAAYGKE